MQLLAAQIEAAAAALAAVTRIIHCRREIAGEVAGEIAWEAAMVNTCYTAVGRARERDAGMCNTLCRNS